MKQLSVITEQVVTVKFPLSEFGQGLVSKLGEPDSQSGPTYGKLHTARMMFGYNGDATLDYVATAWIQRPAQTEEQRAIMGAPKCVFVEEDKLMHFRGEQRIAPEFLDDVFSSKDYAEELVKLSHTGAELRIIRYSGQPDFEVQIALREQDNGNYTPFALRCTEAFGDRVQWKTMPDVKCKDVNPIKNGWVYKIGNNDLVEAITKIMH